MEPKAGCPAAGSAAVPCCDNGRERAPAMVRGALRTSVGRAPGNQARAAVMLWHGMGRSRTDKGGGGEPRSVASLYVKHV